jgi:hypothetical protein
MKAFALAVVAAAGLLCSAGTADAQWRSRGSYGYTYPSYTYSYPTYSYPTFGSVAPTSDGGVVVTSGYTPVYTAPVYPSGYYYPSNFGSYPSYYGSGYNGVYVSPSGYMSGRRGWRW